MVPARSETPAVITLDGVDHLLALLSDQGYVLIGPTQREGAIVYDEIAGVRDLPVGFTDEQEPGHYRLHRRSDAKVFGYTVGPHSWKKYLNPADVLLWRGHKEKGGFRVDPEKPTANPMAFIGVRGCELAAIAIQDRVFLGGAHVDPVYAAHRKRVFILAVQCTQSSPTCFCSSMGTGPAVREGFDLRLTEVLDSSSHWFLVEAGSEAGDAILQSIAAPPATRDQMALATAAVERTRLGLVRTLDTEGLKDRLLANLEHERWEDVAHRCLMCANCTMVCPTCFCSTVEDVSDITGNHVERWRRWDSCFTVDFSHLHGGSVRSSPRSRYRQWLTHKLATWVDQFGTSGCVGCGRCITWCPVGIDLTVEARAIGGRAEVDSHGSHMIPDERSSK